MYVSGMDQLVSRTYRLIWVGVSSFGSLCLSEMRLGLQHTGHSLVSLVLHSLLTNLPSLDSMGRDIRKQNKACMYAPLGK